MYGCDSDLEIVLEDLQYYTQILLNCFKIISIKPYPKKFQFKIFGKASTLMTLT